MSSRQHIGKEYKNVGLNTLLKTNVSLQNTKNNSANLSFPIKKVYNFLC